MDSTPNKPVQGDLETYSILIADDDRTMADLLSTNLRRIGHRVAGIARNGKEAVDMVLKLQPDVAILDIHMPLLTGLQAAREILAKREMPIVLSTGMSDIKSLNMAVDLRVISYLVKPFSPAQLKVSVHLAVSQYRASLNHNSAAAA